MRYPYWKKVLSYIIDIPVESVSSTYHPDLHVVLSKGRHQLNAGKAIYSYDDLYVNFEKLFTQYLDLKEAKNVLILGLGLGSIPLILDRLRPGGWYMTTVEIDEVICVLAEKYTLHGLASSVQTVVADAESFVEITSEKYDLVCVDLFVETTIPHRFLTINFLNKLKEILTDDGLLVYNTLAFNKSDKKDSQRWHEEVFQSVFHESRLIYIHQNNMILNHDRWIKLKQ